MTHGHPIIAAHACDRTLVDGKDHRVAFLQVRHVRPGLHARALLGEQKLATGKVLPAF